MIETLGHHDVDWKLRSVCKVSGAFHAIYEHEKSDLDVERILLLCSFLEQFCEIIHVLFRFLLLIEKTLAKYLATGWYPTPRSASTACKS